MVLFWSILFQLASLPLSAFGQELECKCTPKNKCWPSEQAWSSLNSTLNGALVQGVPPGSVCYPDQPNYNEATCAHVASQWFNSSWHATDPVSIDYPIWTNNSCNPIWPNGTSVTGDPDAGVRGCSIGAYPVYVVNATTAEQISTALQWAERHNIRVIIKSTGHSFPGRSVGYGSLSIWTHHMRGIEYIEDFKPTECPFPSALAATRVAAGHTGYEVLAELEKHSTIIVTGANPDVGLVGWLTGGGHGALSQTYGMGADNLLEATIVTASGEVLIANPCKNADIFFAIRGGGGGTYGVVTEVVVKAFRTQKTTAHILQLASLRPDISTEFWDLIGFLHAEFPRLKEAGMQGYYFFGGIPFVPTLSFQWVFLLHGDHPDGTIKKLISPIEDYLNERKDLFAYHTTIKSANTFFSLWGAIAANEAVATGGAAMGSRLLDAESLSNATRTSQLFAEIGPSVDASKPNGPLTNPLFIGHMIAPANPPAYYPDVVSMNPAWYKTSVHLVVVEGWPDGTPQHLVDAVYDDITHVKTEALRGFSPRTGAYFNEADSYELEWQEAFFGKHYERLRAVKEKYDPRNLFWCRRCVGSEGLVEQVDGRLCKVIEERMDL